MFKAIKKYLYIDFNPHNASFFDFLKLEFYILAFGEMGIGVVGRSIGKYIGLIDMLFVIPAFLKMVDNILERKIHNPGYIWYLPLILLKFCYFISWVFTASVSAVITLISSPFVFLTQQYYHRAGNRLRQLVSKINVVTVSNEEIIDLGFQVNDYVIEKSKLKKLMTSKKNKFLYFKDHISHSSDHYYYATRDHYCKYVLRPIILKDNKNHQLIFGIFKIDHDWFLYRSPTALLFIGKDEFSSLKSLLKLVGIEYQDSNQVSANARNYNPKSPIFTPSYVTQLYGAKFEAELLYSFLPEINPLQELRQIPILAQLAVTERAKEAIRGSGLTQLENAIQPLLSTITSMAGLPPLSNDKTRQLKSFSNRNVKKHFAIPFSLQTEPEEVNQNTLSTSR